MSHEFGVGRRRSERHPTSRFLPALAVKSCSIYMRPLSETRLLFTSSAPKAVALYASALLIHCSRSCEAR